MSDIKTLKQNILYQGYNQYTICDFKIPSYKETPGFIILSNREVLKTKNAIHVLIYSKEIDSFVFCQQFRSGAFLNDQSKDPFLIECIAGTIEPDETPEESAIKEVKEEAGLTVDKLDFIFTGYSSPGIMTEKSYLYCATVIETPTPIIGGLASEGEDILTHVISRKSAYQMMDSNGFADCKTMLALTWFRSFDKAPP